LPQISAFIESYSGTIIPLARLKGNKEKKQMGRPSALKRKKIGVEVRQRCVFKWSDKMVFINKRKSKGSKVIGGGGYKEARGRGRGK